jgi:hypothetical protein
MNGIEVPVINTAAHTSDTPQLLLEHHLKELRLPTILREYDKVARQCAVEQVDYNTICCASPNWSYWTASAGQQNAASGKRSSRSSRPWTASTSSPSPR